MAEKRQELSQTTLPSYVSTSEESKLISHVRDLSLLLLWRELTSSAKNKTAKEVKKHGTRAGCVGKNVLML